MIEITKAHYILQVDGRKIRLIRYTAGMKGAFHPVNSLVGARWLEKFNRAFPRTHYTATELPAESVILR